MPDELGASIPWGWTLPSGISSAKKGVEDTWSVAGGYEAYSG